MPCSACQLNMLLSCHQKMTAYGMTSLYIKFLGWQHSSAFGVQGAGESAKSHRLSSMLEATVHGVSRLDACGLRTSYNTLCRFLPTNAAMVV